MNFVIKRIRELVKDGLQRVLGMHIEAFEPSADHCGSGNGGVWDLFAG